MFEFYALFEWINCLEMKVKFPPNETCEQKSRQGEAALKIGRSFNLWSSFALSTQCFPYALNRGLLRKSSAAGGEVYYHCRACGMPTKLCLLMFQTLCRSMRACFRSNFTRPGLRCVAACEVEILFKKARKASTRKAVSSTESGSPERLHHEAHVRRQVVVAGAGLVGMMWLRGGVYKPLCKREGLAVVGGRFRFHFTLNNPLLCFAREYGMVVCVCELLVGLFRLLGCMRFIL